MDESAAVANRSGGIPLANVPGQFTGAVVFVLHTHLPYVRMAGRWPHGEEWLHEAASESYIPLLIMLDDLRAEGVPFRVTWSITPVLAEQLADPLVRENFDRYLDSRIAAADNDEKRFENGIPHLRYLAGWTRDYYLGIRQAYNDRFGRDLLGALRRLRDAGTVELATSAATHAYLPMLGNDSSVRAQVETGIRTHRRIFGENPASFWLPEAGYRPAFTTDDGRERAGLEAILADYGVRLTFTDAHAITGGRRAGITAFGQTQPDPSTQNPVDSTGATLSTFSAYAIGSADGRGSGLVTALGRNAKASEQVWSSKIGYPGDGDYREFYRYDPDSGMKYWRVTGKEVALGAKDMYHPDWAKFKVEQHAEHYAHMAGDMLRKYHRNTGQTGVVLAAFNTELFGHWWFEGVQWLGETLRHLADFPEIQMTTAADYVARHPAREILDLPQSSWSGEGGGANGAQVSLNREETRWMWNAIHEAEARMATIAATPTDNADVQTVRAQAARELLLLQSSDWLFLVAARQARDAQNYGVQRFNQHLERFEQLAESLEAGAPNVTLANEYFRLDRVFSDIDPAQFGG